MSSIRSLLSYYLKLFCIHNRMQNLQIYRFTKVSIYQCKLCILPNVSEWSVKCPPSLGLHGYVVTKDLSSNLRLIFRIIGCLSSTVYKKKMKQLSTSFRQSTNLYDMVYNIMKFCCKIPKTSLFFSTPNQSGPLWHSILQECMGNMCHGQTRCTILSYYYFSLDFFYINTYKS